MKQPSQRNNYDPVAGIYDRLAGIVFGTALVRSQLWLLRHPLAGTRVMIAGGGTGIMLEAFGKMDIPPLDITFVELSGKMIRQAQKRNTGKHKVHFVNSAAEQFTPGYPPDVMITPFLFDNFTADKASEVFAHLHDLLGSGGTWLFTDFYLRPGAPWWQRFLLKCMYRFFGVIADVATNRLPDMEEKFRAAGYSCEQEHFFYRGFIRSALYRKPPNKQS